MCDICTMEFYSDTKKNVTTCSEKQIELELIISSRINQAKKDKHGMASHIRDINFRTLIGLESRGELIRRDVRKGR